MLAKFFNQFDILYLSDDNVQHANMETDDTELHIRFSKLISEPSAIFKPCYLMRSPQVILQESTL